MTRLIPPKISEGEWLPELAAFGSDYVSLETRERIAQVWGGCDGPANARFIAASKRVGKAAATMHAELLAAMQGLGFTKQTYAAIDELRASLLAAGYTEGKE